MGSPPFGRTLISIDRKFFRAIMCAHETIIQLEKTRTKMAFFKTIFFTLIPRLVSTIAPHQKIMKNIYNMVLTCVWSGKMVSGRGGSFHEDKFF